MIYIYIYRYNFEGRKNKRKESVDARKAIYDKLTIEQKLNKAVPGSKEYSKLLQKVQK